MCFTISSDCSFDDMHVPLFPTQKVDIGAGYLFYQKRDEVFVDFDLEPSVIPVQHSTTHLDSTGNNSRHSAGKSIPTSITCIVLSSNCLCLIYLIPKLLF